jgi:diguanylate cyclase (GGDEF)-like protein/PAS domain S-box-containing protein
MGGAMSVLLETILKMYDSLSSRTLQLMREIANRQRAEAQVRLSKEVIDSTLEAIFVTDAAGLIIDTNPVFCVDAGIAHEQLLGMNIRQIKPNLFTHEKAAEIWQTATNHGHWSGEILGRDASGEMQAGWLALSAIKDIHGVITHYIGVFSSLAQLIQRQYSLEKAANFDSLTGLPNRRLLPDRLAQALMRSKRNGHLLAICFLDLDGFKQVNDSLGHDAGDELLCLVALHLARLLRGEDTVVRLGGDEFVLLLGDLQSELAVTQLLDRLLQDIAQPFTLKNGIARVSASIGVTVYPNDSSEQEQLLEHADQAMYQAKNSGKSRYHFYRSM